MTSDKNNSTFIIYILSVEDDSGDIKHKMKAGDMTVYNGARGEVPRSKLGWAKK